ncbi:PGF-CTERM-anchored ABC transporter substrate-binding protein [Halorarius litoreus]|uniref:PGF-CTERM-anchored ABC transporter substrate-binding protein n=1 Tax=Halorarius litoreus TaxID=2962676 RepID=UPI0020CB84B3|nr:PGF-CTERM-anchored ABC transporter substrate-binding protein [Halorarius litoreus]
MRIRFSVVFATLVVLAALAPVGVAAAPAAQTADCSFPLTVTDASGTEMTLEERPGRVTTLNPSAAQTMWELDAQAQVVGRTTFAAYLDGADAKTNVSKSGGFGVSVEKVIGTEPDLVLAPNTTSAETVTKLREAGLTVYLFSSARSIEDVAAKTTTIGRLTGNCEAAARTNAWMNANVEAAREATADRDRPGVMYPLGGGYVAGGETFITAMIDISGGTNVLAAENVTGYPQLNDETVLELAPEVIITTDANRYLVGQEPYASTPAGENNRTVDVDVNYLNQPAPRSVVYATRNLTTGFHPDAEVEWVAKSEISLATATASPSPTSESEMESDTTQSPTPTDGSGAGFGLVAALLALVGLGLVRRTE